MSIAAQLSESLPPAWKNESSVLEDAWLKATQRWPSWDVPPAAYAGHVMDRVPQSCVSLRSLHLEDLFVTCACLRGSTQAIVYVHQAFQPDLDKVLAKVSHNQEIHADAKQKLHEHLFVAKDGAPPKIAGYKGNGPLAAFLKVVVSRLALELIRKQVKEVDEPMADRVADAALEPELAFLKQKYRAEFKTAFADAARQLPDRERAVLRYQVADGLSIDQIGTIYGVHRATAARWAASGREILLKSTQQLMRERLKVDPDEMASIMRLLESQLEASVLRVLQTRSRIG